MTPAVKAVNLAFKQSEQTVSKDLIKKKFKVANAFWGKVDDSGSFPRNSGTTIKGIRLGRVGVTNEHGWDGVSDNLCETNMCEELCPEVLSNGFEEYTYSLIRRCVRTDWICINSLVLREMPEEELAHFESGIQNASRYLWDECYRSRYYDMCGNKFVVLVDPGIVGADGACDCYSKSCAPDIRTDGYIFERRKNKDGTFGEMDERFLRVNVSPMDIPAISEITLDMLDEASAQLEYDDENRPALSDDIDLFDVVLAHNRMGTRLAEQEDQQMNNAMSYGGHNAQFLQRKLGTKKVFRDKYSIRYDLHAPRFYPDVEYNTNVLPNFGAYNPLNPQTWPRFKRVFAYMPVRAQKAGIKYVINPGYRWAPFGLSSIYSPMVIKGLQFPDIDGIRSARKKSPGTELRYAGTATWYNPDWKENENREYGFWKLRFGIGIKPLHTEFGFSWFHRIDHRIATQFNCCPIRPAACIEDVSPYCGMNTQGEDGFDNLAPVAQGANIPIFTGSYV